MLFRCLAPKFVLLACTAATAAPYTGPWHLTWDFNDGLQGWTLGQAGTATGRWVNPAWEPQGPMLPDGGYSGAGGGNLYLPDRSFAKFDVSHLNLGSSGANGPARNGFVFQARVYVPNLRPLTGFVGPRGDEPGNMIKSAGIGIERPGDLKGLYFEGDLSSTRCTLVVRENAWDNIHRRLGNQAMEDTNYDTTRWWDQWITLQVDYSFTVPNHWSAYAYIPWTSPDAYAGWHTLAENIESEPYNGYQVAFLRLGGAWSWTQAQFDDVRLAYVPEPSSVILLAAGAALAFRRPRS